MAAQTSKNPDKVRQTLLAAAFREIHLYGFQAASIANILDETGLTKGALYHHFPTKLALGIAVMDAFIRPKFAPLIDDLKGEKGLESLIPSLQMQVRQMDDETVRRGCPLNNLLNEMSPLDRMFQSKLLAVVHEFQTALMGAIRRSQGAGTIEPAINSGYAAWFILSAWLGGVGMAKLAANKQPLYACLEQLEAYLASISSSVTPPSPDLSGPAPVTRNSGEPAPEEQPKRSVSMDWD